MTTFVVDEDQAGQRLDVVIAAELDISRSRAAARIQTGDVTVDGVAVGKPYRLRVGERVEIAAAPPAVPTPAPPVPPIRYRDEHLLVVAKPAGLVVHPGAGHAGDTLVDALTTAGIPLAPAAGADRPGIVHRLDRDTSGLLMVASTDLAYERLVAALAERSVVRRYLAMVVGRPADPRGRIEAPIGREPGSRTRFGVVAGGRPGVTRYHVLATGQTPSDPPVEVSLVACRLETGRTHQIRVHLTALGHPVVGDPTYRPRPAVAQALGVDRPMLHATSLRFLHPISDEVIEVEEPPPADLVRACELAGIAGVDTLLGDALTA